jgi:hypothetical protein
LNTKQGVAERDIIRMKKRRAKLPVRLNAQPSKPHSTRKGARGYNRRRAKAQLRKELRQAD